MGGIFACICRHSIRREAIREGLRRLYYRGYDGLGIAYLDSDGRLVILKEPGSPDKAWQKMNLPDTIPSRIVLGHVRYASRGWPNYENTHPLTDCSGRIACVGDGVISNYVLLRKKLIEKGHRFRSTTDFEVLPHMLEEYIMKRDALSALRNIAGEADGIYSAVFLLENKYSFLLLHHGQPLVIGLRRDGECIYVSSDLPSLYGFADEALILEENMIAEVGLDGITIIDVETGEPVERLIRKRVKYAPNVVDKGGYPHYMLKEIYEIPYALRQTLVTLLDKYLKLAAMIIQGASNIYVIGNGTSLHAGYASAYYFSDIAGVNIEVISAAEFPYYALKHVRTGTVVIAISQSGETSDVIHSVKEAKRHGAVIIGITNVVGSRLTLESNVYLPIGAGPEIAVPATKTFTSTLAAILILAAYTGLYTGRIEQSDLRQIYKDIEQTANKLSDLMNKFEKKIEEIIKQEINWSNVYVSSSGINYPIALEGALKLKETAIIHSEGIQLGELRHGPLVLLKPGFPIILIEPYEEEALELYRKVRDEAINRGAYLLKIASRDTEVTSKSESVIETINVPKHVTPIVNIIPLQLLAYKLGVKYGRPIDTPPGLVKAVTT